MAREAGLSREKDGWGKVLANGDMYSITDVHSPRQKDTAERPLRGKLLYRSSGPAQLRPAANHTWVEVTRRASLREGQHGYGCWFHLLLPPYGRGTGVFVNVGRTLVFEGFNEARNALRPHNATCGNDCLEAQTAHERGYDSVQMLHGKVHNHPELMVAREACLNSARPFGTCPPRGIEMRSGWDARLPCACTDDGEWLNCGLSWPWASQNG